MKYAGDKCPYCKRTLTKSWQKARDNERIQNAIASSHKAVKSGKHRHGRKRKLSADQHEEIKNLYNNTRYNRPSMRKLAKMFSVSTTVVQKILRNGYK